LALLDPIEATARAIAGEVQDTTAIVLPGGGVHDELTSAFGAGEGREGGERIYRLIVSRVGKTFEL